MTRNHKRRRNIKPRIMWTFGDVRKKSPAAIAVWGILQDMAVKKGSNYIHTSREELCELARYTSPKTITTATGILQKAGWIKKEISVLRTPAGFKKVVEIVIRRNKVMRKTSKTSRDFKVKGNTASTRFQKTLKNPNDFRVKGNTGGNDSLTERGCDNKTPPPLADAGESSSRTLKHTKQRNWIAEDKARKKESAMQSHPILKPMRLTETGWVYTDPPDRTNEKPADKITRIEREKLEWARFNRERQQNAVACFETNLSARTKSILLKSVPA